ncbi:hypothetical protein MKX01_041127 [Papaver californicum]|nr:hypothetical protein MKX01_041127 [Papaver californicum]
MEVRDWEVSSDGTQDSEVNLKTVMKTSFFLCLVPYLNYRKAKSKARWDLEMRMAEVLKKKGRCWATTGIVRNGNTYLSIEEAAYEHLKSLRYIVVRHGIQWTLKKDKQHCSTPTGVRDSIDNNGVSICGLEEEFSITNGLRDMHIKNEAKPTFDVYLCVVFVCSQIFCF